MAEKQNSSKSNLIEWNKFEEIDETTASPAGMTRATEAKIQSFNITERLKNLNRGHMVLKIAESKFAA